MARSGRAPRSAPSPRAKKTPRSTRPSAPPQPQPEPLPPLRLGFVRGVAPSKWADRWARSVPEQPLELVPLGIGQVDAARDELDAVLERVAPGELPPGTNPQDRRRHAFRLYEESIALVVPSDHELAAEKHISFEDLELTRLLAHPDHSPAWPPAEPWADPSWAPRNAAAALELVATGLGAVLLPQPLARHLADKHLHRVIPLAEGSDLSGTEIWLSWSIERDGEDLQRLAGLLRGRTPRSSR